MQIHPDYSQHELFARAATSIAASDYLQALRYYEELMQLRSGQNESEEINFFSGPYQDLLYKTGNHANMLAGLGYYLQAYKLVDALLARLKNSEDDTVIDWLKNLENECLRNALFSRKSAKINDAIICCADDSIDNVQRPLVAALHKLGVSVQPQPYTVPTNHSEFSFKDIPFMSDAILVIISPGFFASPWPEKELEEIIGTTGSDSIQVIPIWYALTRPEVLAASESLEKILAFDTTTKDVSEIAQGIADILRPDLASNALHKTIWASLLHGKILSEAFTDFALPVRHKNLDKDLVDRIRLIRAAFLDGNRQMMRSWQHGFCCELEPHTAIGEWEHLACIFQEIQIARRYTNLLKDAGVVYKEENNCIVDLVTDNIDLFAEIFSLDVEDEAAICDRLVEYFLELAEYSSDRIFVLVWLISQSTLKQIDLGFGQQMLSVTEMFFFDSHVPLFEPADDWANDVSAMRSKKDFDKSFDPVIKTWDLTEEMKGQENIAEGILHTDEERPWSKEWDVFISHASEDKAEFVRPLAEALKEYGVKVWYDSFTLKAGKSLGDSIFAGINAAEFGIIVLSPNFIKKEWPRKEYEFLQKNQKDQGDRLMTFWYKLTPDQRPGWIKDFDFATSLYSPNQSITALTMAVLEKIRPDLARYIQKKMHYQNAHDERNNGNVQMKEIRLSDIKIGSQPRYERLPAALVQRVRLIRSVLFEGYSHSLKFWLDGFLCDYDPERQIEDWQRIASMFQEAIMLVEFLETQEQIPLSSTEPGIEHDDIYRMIYTLNSYPDEILMELREKYPEKIVDSILAIVSAPDVIDLLDPD